MREKRNTYYDYWLSKDMENMGYLFEYCDTFCHQYLEKQGETTLLCKYVDRDKFLNTFMCSKMRLEMEDNHPKLLSQAAIDSFFLYIEVDCKGDIEQFLTDTEPASLPKNMYYWVGWAYSYIHHQADIHFKDLVSLLPLNYMLENYHVGHEMDISIFYDKVKERLGVLE